MPCGASSVHQIAAAAIAQLSRVVERVRTRRLSMASGINIYSQIVTSLIRIGDISRTISCKLLIYNN